VQSAGDNLFKALADPTRRSIFEHLVRDGEQSVRAITDRSTVSQPMVSKHLAVLKAAGLVRDRRDGREIHYSARIQALTPMIDWLGHHARGLITEPLHRETHGQNPRPRPNAEFKA
jgi:DNA-binding transcriptional ArsR family regulator